MSTLYQTVILALVVAFIVLFLNKTGFRIKLRDYFDLHNLYKVAEMLDCDFCTCFWTAFVLVFILQIIGIDVNILTAICATPLARYLL